MRPLTFFFLYTTQSVLCSTIASARNSFLQPSSVECHGNGAVYRGLHKDTIEGFVGISFAHDTGGVNRFKPPMPFIPPADSTIEATNPGPACPQATASRKTAKSPFSAAGAGPPQEISEDCLRLNVWRPNGTQATDGLPVLVWIYGGGFTSGYKDEPGLFPGELISQSVNNRHPIIHVEMNYRLGVFGFAQSQSLADEGSQNAGLRDQRLALEWVEQNIASFGGDPSRVTIHGQSSGGLAVGMQMMAFGANRSFPFHQAICESQALESGITGNYTGSAMARVVHATHCRSRELDSISMLECLRSVQMESLLDAQLSTATEANIGDEWLPVVDGPNGFLPAAPSRLIDERRFAQVSTMMGWCEDDGTLFTPEIRSADETREFVRFYLPQFSTEHLDHLLGLYPISEFEPVLYPNSTIAFSAQRYRASRILRDILFTCQPLYYAQALAQANNTVYLYDQNATLWTEALEAYGLYGYGVIHTSELLYIFANITAAVDAHFPIPHASKDFELRNRESRSWSSFTALGRPSLLESETLQGWQVADFTADTFSIYVIGGPNAGSSGPGGAIGSAQAMKLENLRARCQFLNAPEVITQTGF